MGSVLLLEHSLVSFYAIINMWRVYDSIILLMKGGKEINMTDNNMLTQTEVLLRGWTKSMIEKLLPEPKLAKNKHCSKYPTKLWSLEVVEQIEQTEEYKEYLEKAQKRSESRYKAASRRREATQKEFEVAKDNINITLVEDSQLRKWVYEEKREYNISISA